MLTALEQHFPALMPLLKYHKLSTPLAVQAMTGAYHGATYGLEASPRRCLSSVFNSKTPITGLYLAGQDAGTPGIAGAMWGAVMTAGAIEPKVFNQID
jgi:all-trans-retinol 13,14-reductase